MSEIEMDRRPTEREAIAAARALMRIEQIRLHHFPRWMSRPTRIVMKKLKLRWRGLGLVGNERMARFTTCIGELGGDGSIENWGTFRTSDHECFASEPFGCTARWLASWERFAELRGLEMKFSAASWHRPGNTCRLILRVPRT